MNKNKIKKIISYIFTALCVIVVLLTSIEVVSATKDSRPPSILGYSISYVPTESMEPEIDGGLESLVALTTSIDVNNTTITHKAVKI